MRVWHGKRRVLTEFARGKCYPQELYYKIGVRLTPLLTPFEQHLIILVLRSGVLGQNYVYIMAADELAPHVAM